MPSKQTFNIRMYGGEWATRMTCQEAGCPNNARGWLTALDLENEDHAILATWIKQSSGRRFYEMWSQDAAEEIVKLQGRDVDFIDAAQLMRLAPGLKVFIFPAGQQCFAVHEDREVKFLHQKPTGIFEHASGRDFNEHYNEEAYKLQRAAERG